MKNTTVKRKSMLSRFIKGAAGFFALTIISSVMVTVLDAVFPQVIRYTVDTLINNGEPSGVTGAVASFFGGAEYLKVFARAVPAHHRHRYVPFARKELTRY